MQTRLRIVGISFVIAFLAISVKLFYWQIIKGSELSAQAESQYRSGRKISAPRGNILASDNTASLPEVKDSPKEVANKLALYFVDDTQDREALLIEVGRIESLLLREDVVWVPLKHKVDPEIKKSIEDLNIDGVGFEPEDIRIYPEASVAAHTVGIVGKDDTGSDVGYFGLEGYYDLILSGKSGFLTQELDAKGLPILIGNLTEVTAIEGVDLVTHLDKGIQLSLDEKLKEGVEKYQAASGTAIVMDPNNGAILGMSSFPSFDPVKYSEYSNEDFVNPAVSLTFEPGSIFKVLIMASALDAGVVDLDTKCDICNKPLKIDKYTIGTWDNKYHPDSTMVDVIVNSDNVGMAFVGQRLGSDKLYNYLDAFRVGYPTEIDLQGEVNPGLRDKEDWSVVDTVTASFGQGVAVTPIQMIRAVSAVANGGKLVTPQVVDKLKGDSWEEDIQPEVLHQVISEESTGKIKAMMVEASKKGESKWTHLRGFDVAGKTGTAQIPIKGHYDEEKTIASFVGFAPASDPKFIMLITLREPSTSPWASETAAPLWYSIAKDLFLHFGIQPKD
jgi:cell division protein FtsI/penicillin-binding protein 2